VSFAEAWWPTLAMVRTSTYFLLQRSRSSSFSQYGGFTKLLANHRRTRSASSAECHALLQATRMGSCSVTGCYKCSRFSNDTLARIRIVSRHATRYADGWPTITSNMSASVLGMEIMALNHSAKFQASSPIVFPHSPSLSHSTTRAPPSMPPPFPSHISSQSPPPIIMRQPRTSSTMPHHRHACAVSHLPTLPRAL